ncbi:MAG: ATP-binding protein [Deltaproteobacteria bacterium]|nr:ATP-binding protein [Deltaproteobacteria bacterium]
MEKVRKFIEKIAVSLEKLNPKTSLRTTLYLWFLVIALVPLLIFAIYSSHKLENVITQELITRIQSHFLSIQTELADLEKSLLNGIVRHAQNSQIIHYLETNNLGTLQNFSETIMRNYITDRVSYYSLNGIPLLHIHASTQVKEAPQKIPQSILNEILLGQAYFVKKTIPQLGISYHAYALIKKNGQNLGILEETVYLDSNYAKAIHKSTNLDIIILDHEDKMLTTNQQNGSSSFNYEDKKIIKKIQVLNPELISKGITEAVELQINNEPYISLMEEIKDSHQKTIGKIGLLVSKNIYYETASRIQGHIFIFVFLLVFILLITVIFASNSIVNPIKVLVEATSQVKKGRFETLSKQATHELGVLTDSFNDMAQSIDTMKKELQDKVIALEKTNKELKETQSRLVHSAKMVSLGKLVAGVAHELNNPIAAIYSNMQHLEEYTTSLQKILEVYKEVSKKLPKSKLQKVDELWKENNVDFILEDAFKIIHSALEGAERTKNIVLGLRNFSRLDEAEKKTVNIHDGIDSTLELLHNQIKDKVIIHKKYADIPAVTCYPSQINQVFMNIINNATQAILKNGDIWIETKQKNNSLEISIKDNGCGIEEKYLENVFDPFFTTKEVGKGTGMGLSISYNIIKKHKGSLTVKSKKGEGTTFIITLPLSRKDLKKATA